MGAFPAEIAVHFPGWPRISEPAVFVFPQLIVCFNCGVAEFAMPEKQLIELAKGRAAGAT